MPELSQISMPTTADHAAPAVQLTALELVITPADGLPNAGLPIVAPFAVYPVADSSVPSAVLMGEPLAVMSRRKNGGVTVNADPPPVPGV